MWKGRWGEGQFIMRGYEGMEEVMARGNIGNCIQNKEKSDVKDLLSIIFMMIQIS